METFGWHTILIAFGLSLFAGLSTGIGSTIAFFARTTNKRFLSASLGFSAGVMLYLSFIEIFPKAREILEGAHGAIGYLYTTLAFFGGIFLMALIDHWVPQAEIQNDISELTDGSTAEERKAHLDNENGKLMRMGQISALAIAIHNFPDGFVTFIGALQETSLGISIAVAIAIHNIPEGLAVSVPIYYATGNKRLAFKYSFLSGLAEPLGALIGFTLLRPFLNDTLFGIVFAGIAGIMVYIALDELLPTAEKYAEHHIALWGLVAGMALMALSLLLLG